MADVREFFSDVREAIDAALDHRQAHTFGTMVAKIVEFDKEKLTGKLQPLIKSTVVKHDGTTERVSFPQLEDVPINFSQGGPTILTHPVKKDDEVMVQVGARMIDNWHEKGDEQDHNAVRAQDLSDTFFFTGPRSKPNAKKLKGGADDKASQLRSLNAEHHYQLHAGEGDSGKDAKGLQEFTKKDIKNLASENHASQVGKVHSTQAGQQVQTSAGKIVTAASEQSSHTASKYYINSSG
jgi:hypothetical protein